MSNVADGLQELRSRWWWLLVLGVLLVVLGLVALSAMVVATLATVIYFGVLLLISGASHVASAFSARAGRGLFFHLLIGLLDAVVGLVMVARPDKAALVLTLVLAVAFLVGGAFRIISAFAIRYPGWPLLALSGVIGLALGACILLEWPESGMWVIGLFLGIDLISRGLSWVTTALAVRGSVKVLG
jgi:uncharacterized membrane protein HdeD (DUF308 family)